MFVSSILQNIKRINMKIFETNRHYPRKLAIVCLGGGGGASCFVKGGGVLLCGKMNT